MNGPISQEQLSLIGVVLGVEPRSEANHFRYDIAGTEPTRQMSLEIYPEIPIGPATGALVCLYTPSANLQLQHCSGVVISELLGEVTFVAEAGGKVSGLIVERDGGCSLYANVDRSLLSGDFTTLGPEVMMSGVALSLTELILPEEDEGELPQATKP